jgi:DNA-binding MarR family transcriptional regulator
MQLLWAVAHGLESASQRMRTTVGVTSPQRLVLRLIAHYGSSAPGDLAAVLHLDPSSLTGLLRRLEHAGLVRRIRHPEDGRRAILTLTARGRALNDRRVGTVEASVTRTLKRLSTAKIAVAREVLGELARELDAPVESPSPLTAKAGRSPRQKRRRQAAVRPGHERARR